MTDAERIKLSKRRKISNRKYREKKKSERRAAEEEKQKDTAVEATSKKSAGRKKVKSNRAAVYRDLKKSKEQNSTLQRKIWRLQKRLSADRKSKVKTTPRSKVRQFLGGRLVPSDVKRKLLFGEVLHAELVEDCNTKSLKKHTISQILSGRVIKRYRMLRESKSFLSQRVSRKYRSSSSEPKEGFVKNQSEKSCTKNKRVIDFFLRDVTTVCPRKNSYVIKYKGGKVKKRKRYLRATLKDLYSKYCSGELDPVCYVTFVRMKPFYCVMPKLSGRDTCLCTLCENVRLLVEALFKAKIINESSPTQLVNSICCDKRTEECLKRGCTKCKDKAVIMERDSEEVVSYQQWENLSVQKGDKKGVMKVFKRWDTVNYSKPACELSVHFDKVFSKYLAHIHRDEHQQNCFRHFKENLSQGEMYLHFDWSENYIKKKEREIQSAYYGASKEEVSLHTGMAYVQGDKVGFCTMSDSNKHSPANIVSHLIPVLKVLFEKHPGISKLILQSDSPTSQYRGKDMFWVTTQYLTSIFFQITDISYGYSEGGHGKGAADGIGGWAKNTLDGAALHGQDLRNAQDMVNFLQKKSERTIILHIESSAAEEVQKVIPSTLKPFEGTMRMHAFTWTKEHPQTLHFGSLSCVECEPGTECVHFKMPNSPLVYANPTKSGNPKKNQLSQEESQNGERPTTQNVGVGDWVAVKYGEHWYPGIVEKTSAKGVTANFMHLTEVTGKQKTKNDVFLWPQKDDRQLVKKRDILYVLLTPPIAVDRVHFKVTEQATIDLKMQ